MPRSSMSRSPAPTDDAAMRSSMRVTRPGLRRHPAGEAPSASGASSSMTSASGDGTNGQLQSPLCPHVQPFGPSIIDSHLADLEQEMAPSKRQPPRGSDGARGGSDGATSSGTLARDEDGTTPKKKRKKAVPTTARTLAECRRRGWIAGVVERRIPYPRPRGTKIDLFGVIDVVAIAPGVQGAIGIQSTANIGGHHAKHRDKILAEARARQWVEAGNRLELWTWAKQGARGKAKRWTLRVEAFTLESWPTVGPRAG